MLRRQPPPDNFPDDFDSERYHRYQPHFHPGIGHWLRFRFPRVALAVLIVCFIILGIVLGLFLLPESDPEIIIIVPTLSAENTVPIGGGFPPNLNQQFINLPARIDHTLGFGEQHAYRFVMKAGLTWTLTLTPAAGIDPVLSLYDGSGTLLDTERFPGGGQSLSITYTAPTEDQYGIVIETAENGATAGGYTLTIFPQ